MSGKITRRNAIGLTAIGCGAWRGWNDRADSPETLGQIKAEGITSGKPADAGGSGYRVQPHVDRTLSFDDAPSAYRYLEKGGMWARS